MKTHTACTCCQCAEDAAIRAGIADALGDGPGADRLAQAVTADTEAAALAGAMESARRTLGLATLADRNSDRLDFHDIGVATLRDAIEIAFDHGVREGRRQSGTDTGAKVAAEIDAATDRIASGIEAETRGVRMLADAIGALADDLGSFSRPIKTADRGWIHCAKPMTREVEYTTDDPDSDERAGTAIWWQCSECGEHHGYEWTPQSQSRGPEYHADTDAKWGQR